MTAFRQPVSPFPLGAERMADGIRFSFITGEEECGVLLYDRAKGKQIAKVPFLKQDRMGNVHYKYLPDIDAAKVSYLFYAGDKIIPDAYARCFSGRKAYGRRQEAAELKACLVTDLFDWENDTYPHIPYEDAICYCMHVRGFTKHISSDAAHRGTFPGIVEKIPYLKELGITTIELQPAYEFLEVEAEADIPSEFPAKSVEQTVEQTGVANGPGENLRLNYWGYKKGFYYAPKAGYAAGNDAVREFKEMVKALHKNGLEVVMQFYFPKTAAVGISEILRFWVREYHVDGFHLMGEDLPITMTVKDAALADTKIWYYDFDVSNIYEGGEPPEIRRLAEYQDDFLYDMRRFLKGDDNMLDRALYHMRSNPENIGRLNYLTNYYGFTLMDLVSYSRKHNEENKEANRDGIDQNESWNCGTEGNCRRKKVVSLRIRQIKNALSMLFLSQATPLIFMGDEFGNSQQGNNNPYCQDNEITWLNWRDREKNNEIFDYAAALIRFRKEHPILHCRRELRIMDYLSCGYPDLSYHGEVPWRPVTDRSTCHIGLMYCGQYAKTAQDKADDFIYIVFNMHWEAHEFAMPKLPKGMVWQHVLLTKACPEPENSPQTKEKWTVRKIPPRSTAIFISTGIK